MSLTLVENFCLARCLEGGLFGEQFYQYMPLSKLINNPIPGIYSGLFAIHLALHATKRETDSSKPKIVFYALSVLYVLTGALFAIEIVPVVSNSIFFFFQPRANSVGQDDAISYGFAVADATIFGCCDFIAQCILVRTANKLELQYSIHSIHLIFKDTLLLDCVRSKIHVIIVPSILTFTFLGPSFYLDSLADLDLLPLVMWLATGGSLVIVPNGIDETDWGKKLVLTSLIMSMTVNALVTGLIVFKIFKVCQEDKSVSTTSEDKSFITRRNKLRSVTFIIIESGMALFAIQLARVVVSAIPDTNAAYYAFQFIGVIHEMVNVIILSVILTSCLLITSI